MKNGQNPKIYLIFLGFVFILSTILCYNPWFIASNSDNTHDNKDNSNLKVKLSSSSTISPIYIDDDNPNYNWSKTALENDWCYGSGTIDDPYVIKHITIKGNRTKPCIEIRDSGDLYFEIRNCTLYNGTLGITCDYSKNAKLIDNIIYDNTGTGIRLTHSYFSNSLILGNLITNNGGHGIHMSDCYYIEIESNVIHHHYPNHGIYFSSLCWYNLIKNNTISHNYYGIRIYSSSRFNTIQNNTVEYNLQYGIYVYSFCFNTEVLGNVVRHNQADGILVMHAPNSIIAYNYIENSTGDGIYIRELYNYTVRNNIDVENFNGIRLFDCDESFIINNKIHANEEIGILIYGSDENTISGNHLVGNNQCIIEEYSSNNLITNNLCNEDLFEDNDNINEAKSISIGWTKYLAANDEDWYKIYLNKGDTLFLTLKFSNSSGNLDLALYDNFGYLIKDSKSITDDELLIHNITIDNYYYIQVYNDNNSLYYLNIELEDIISPSIKIISPKLNEFFSAIAPAFEVSITDPNLHKMWYSIDGGLTNITFTDNESINQDLWNLISDGIVNLTFYARDSSGNENMKSVSINKDSLAPSIQIRKPLYNEVFNNISPNFTVRILDVNLESMWYTLSNISYQSEKFFFLENGTIDDDEWNYFSDGLIHINFWSNDTAGNINSSMTSVYKDTNLPDLDINSPFHNQIFSYNAPNFNLSIKEANVNTSWYTLNFSNENFYFSGSYGTINQSIWESMPNGKLLIKFYVKDIAGTIIFKEVQIRKDIYSPQIVIKSPEPDDLFEDTAPSFIVEITDPNLHKMWYSIDGGMINITFTDNETINQDLWSTISDGIVIITFYANDTAGNRISKSVSIIKDTHSPSITILSPKLNEFFSEVAPAFEVSITDPNLHKMWYSIDGGITNITFTDNESINQVLWEIIPDEIVIITFYANDTAGNRISKSVSIIKDTRSPSITIISPNNDGIYGITPPYFELLIEEANLESTWYTIEGIQEIFYFSVFNGTIDETLWDMLEQGIINLTFYANDTAGNVAFESVSIIKSLPTEEFPLTILIITIISAVGAVSVIIITIGILRKRKSDSF